MVETNNIVERIKNRFIYNKIPEKFFPDDCNFENPEYDELYNEYSGLSQHDIPTDDCYQLLYNSCDFSDEVVLYFLPRLADFAINERGDEYFLYLTLDRIKTDTLSEEETSLIEELKRILLELKDERIEQMYECVQDRQDMLQ